MSRRLPPELRDGQYRNWELAMTTRYPLALSEMRWPSAPLDTFETEPLARWGIEIHAGWRAIMERLLERLETEIARQPPDGPPEDHFERPKPLVDACLRAGAHDLDITGEISVKTGTVGAVGGGAS